MKIIISILIIMSLFSCSEKEPCDGVTCSEHGDCKVEENQAICECEDKYISSDLSCIIEFEIKDGTIVDNKTGLIWQNSYIKHKERDAAISYCETLKMNSFEDWKLSNIKNLGDFHKRTNLNGIVPTQMFDGCLAEIATDGYVKTKKGAEDHGGNPGDVFSFSGAANVRCVREK